MNQGIFGFRRYESSSLNYAGIDMHEGEDVGGWDTVLKRKEFDELYASQQASLSLSEAILAAFNNEPTEPVVTSKPVTPKPSLVSASGTITHKYGVSPVAGESSLHIQKPVQKPKEEIKVPVVSVGDVVIHKTLGKGMISFVDQAQKKIRVRFGVGEKLFVYPDAFVNGFLRMKE